jgi:ureidoacrylate peracid hydrolase
VLSAETAELLLRLDQKLDPAHPALVIIDVRNDFAADGGFFGEVGADVRPIQNERVPALARLSAEAHRAGTLVIFVKAIYDPEYLSEPMRERNARVGLEMSRCLTGSVDADLFEVRLEAGEPIVIKHRYNAMVNTNLKGILEQHAIRSLLPAGITTGNCVESLGRNAYFIDDYVTIAADSCDATSEQGHLDALKRSTRDYGQVVTSADVIAIWTTAAAA